MCDYCGNLESKCARSCVVVPEVKDGSLQIRSNCSFTVRVRACACVCVRVCRCVCARVNPFSSPHSSLRQGHRWNKNYTSEGDCAVNIRRKRRVCGTHESFFTAEELEFSDTDSDTWFSSEDDTDSDFEQDAAAAAARLARASQVRRRRRRQLAASNSLRCHVSSLHGTKHSRRTALLWL